MQEEQVILKVQVPRRLADRIRELAEDEGTTTATALEFLIEQAVREKVQTRLTRLEEKQEEFLSMALRNYGKVSTLAVGLDALAERLSGEEVNIAANEVERVNQMSIEELKRRYQKEREGR